MKMIHEDRRQFLPTIYLSVWQGVKIHQQMNFMRKKYASNGCIMIIFLVLINCTLNTKMALLDGTFIHEWLKMSNVFQFNNEQYNALFDHSLLGIKTCWLNHLSLFQVH